ncbi:hypothetical protein LTR99_011032 [Exophiala xenobiotica]|nr:hypothetical protein LTR99_011032 [Exophiala xenobiotica]
MLPGPNPRCNLPQPAMETFGKGLEECFEEILNTLRKLDHFGRSYSPSIFLVYAHDKPNSSDAHVRCVHHLIKWLQKVGAQIFSDRSLLFGVSHRESGNDAVRDILANQICLLPFGNSAGNKEVISRVDKTLPDEVRELFSSFRANGEIHHVHTELAFLQVRCTHASANNHGIIPIALNGDLMEYVPFLEHSNLVIKLQSTTKLPDQHKLFFKVLKQLYIYYGQDIDEFADCYDRVSDRLRRSVNDELESRRLIATEINKAISACNERATAILSELQRRGEPTESHNILEDAITNSLRDLQATDPELDVQRIERSKNPLLKDCYAWVLDDPTLQGWRDGDTSPLLWIKGDPGKGKTMLIIALARELGKSPPGNPRPVAFFFCQNTDPRLNTATSILRGLIWRLATQDAELANIFHKTYQSNSNQLHGPNAIYALFQTLSKMLGVSSRTFTLVDALGECTSGTEREQLLSLIVEHAKSSKTKWLVSSRHDIDIKKVLINEGRMLSLELNEQHISQAVRAFIEQKSNELAKINECSSELNEKVKEELIAKSHSTFLWVALACKRLRKVPSRKALSTLQNYPRAYQISMHG